MPIRKAVFPFGTRTVALWCSSHDPVGAEKLRKAIAEAEKTGSKTAGQVCYEHIFGPPLPLDQALDKFLYHCFLKKLSDKDIVKLAKEHAEWVPVLFNERTGRLKSRQALRDRAVRYQAADPRLSPLEPRKKRSTFN